MSARARFHMFSTIAVLSIVAILAVTAVRFSIGAGHPPSSAGFASTDLRAPAAVNTNGFVGSAGVTAPRFRAPAAVAVRGTKLYISDVATSGIWLRDLESGTEVVIAGALGTGYSGDGGPALQAQLTGPRGLALDAVGDLYIADSGNHVIRRIDVNGIITTVAGDGTRGFSGDGGYATKAQLDNPTGISLDAAGNLYIADTLNHRVRKVDQAGTIVTVVGSGVASLVGGTGGFGFSGDGGPAVDAQLSIPEGVAVNPAGILYVADTGNDRIRSVDLNGTIRTVAGTGAQRYAGDGGPAEQAGVYAPVGISIGPQGIVYFSERDNYSVRMITAQGVMVGVAGRGGVRGDRGDGGPATASELNDPEGITFGLNSELYIADTGNQQIRLVSAGSIKTV